VDTWLERHDPESHSDVGHSKLLAIFFNLVGTRFLAGCDYS